MSARRPRLALLQGGGEAPEHDVAPALRCVRGLLPLPKPRPPRPLDPPKPQRRTPEGTHRYNMNMPDWLWEEIHDAESLQFLMQEGPSREQRRGRIYCMSLFIVDACRREAARIRRRATRAGFVAAIADRGYLRGYWTKIAEHTAPAGATHV